MSFIPEDSVDPDNLKIGKFYSVHTLGEYNDDFKLVCLFEAPLVQISMCDELPKEVCETCTNVRIFGNAALTGDEKCTCILPPANNEYVFEKIKDNKVLRNIIKLSDIKRKTYFIFEIK